MEKEFVPYEQALALKELGFDEPCMMNHYGNDRLHVGRLYLPSSFGKGKNSEMHDDSLRYGDITAILYQQAFRWFRTKHGYFTSPTEKDDDVTKQYDWVITKKLGNGKTLIQFVGYKDSYEEAELECLKKLIEILKNK